jgi:hypothetical protein
MESTFAHARRTYSKVLTGVVKAQIAIAVTGFVFAAVGLVLAHGHSLLAQAALTVLAGLIGLVVGLLLVFLVLWERAGTKQRDDLRAALDATKASHAVDVALLEAEIAQLRGIAPRLEFMAGRVDPNQPMFGGGTQIFVFGAVKNLKALADRGETAKRAVLSLDFYDLDGRHILGPIRGKWRDAPSVLGLNPTQLHSDTEAIDLHPNGSVREFDLGTKGQMDHTFTAIDAAQTPHPLSNNSVARARVRLSGNNFSDIVGTYLVESLGAGGSMRVTHEATDYAPS